MIAERLPSIRVSELRRRIDARLDPGRLRAVVVADEDPSLMARRIAQVRGGRHVDAPSNALALVKQIRAAGEAAVAVSGLEAFPEEEWKHLDLLRSRLMRKAPTTLVLSPRSEKLLDRAAPNLMSLIGPPLSILEGAPDDVTIDAEAQAEFDRHYREWVDSVGFMSSLTRKVSHPAYQRIIAMRERAVPPILRDLEREPKLWGPALQAITGALPVPEGDEGKMSRVAAAWLTWARERGYDW